MWLALVGCGGEQIGESTTTTVEHAGGVHVLRGAAALAGDPGVTLVLGPADCGWWVVGPGDVDGDGVPDVVVGCGIDAGELHYLSGADLLAGVRTELATVAGELSLGDGPQAVGDLDGDGLGDLAVDTRQGSPDDTVSDWGLVVPGAAATGSVRGVDVGWHLQAEAGDHGIPASPAGDFDGDGVPDLALAGADVKVVSGAVVGRAPWGASLDVSAAPLADLARSWPVTAMRGVGDVDGDGLDDLAVATHAPGAPPAVRIVRGGVATGTLEDQPEIAADRVAPTTAVEIRGLGDLDGDGRAELALRFSVFASSEDQWTGVAVVPGSAVPASGTLSMRPYLLTEQDPARIEACDLDGDGRPELVTIAGIWSGADLLTPGAAPIGPGVQPPFACLGDLDGDGTSELAVGDPYLD